MTQQTYGRRYVKTFGTFILTSFLHSQENDSDGLSSDTALHSENGYVSENCYTNTIGQTHPLQPCCLESKEVECRVVL